MTLEDSAKLSEAIGEDAAKRFTKQFEGMDARAVAKLIELIRKMPAENGRFASGESSTEMLNRVGKILRDIIKNEQLAESVRLLMPDFVKIGEVAQIVQMTENNIRIPKALLNDTKQRMIQMTTESIATSNYDARFVIPVKRALYNAISTGATITEVEKAIRRMIGGSSGLLSQYAGGVARDAMHQYEGQVHTQIANKYELLNWRYVGTILPGKQAANGKFYGGSRPQCIRWVKADIIHGADLELELAWARKNGSGLIPGTAASTFGIFRGGYNCRHKAIPTRRT